MHPNKTKLEITKAFSFMDIDKNGKITLEGDLKFKFFIPIIRIY